MSKEVQLLGNKLKEHRAKFGYTQAQLAQAVGVTRKTINTIENHVFVPSTVLALKIANEFNSSVEEIFFLKSADN